MEHFAVDGDDPRTRFAEAGYELLKAGSELLRIDLTKHAAESIVARDTVPQFEKASEELSLCLGEDSHVHSSLAARQDRAQGNYQDLDQVVAFGPDRSRILQLGKACVKSVHYSLRRRAAHAVTFVFPLSDRPRGSKRETTEVFKINIFTVVKSR
jgi:hypothetical protein